MAIASLAFPKNETADLYLPDVAANPAKGIYQRLIESALNRGAEYSKIWDLFAFEESFTVHLARFTQGALRTPASISPAMRELIAASTSFRNQCAFCTQAHAAAASELFNDEALVWNALENLEDSALEPKEKELLRFTNRITNNLPAITREDVDRVRESGWDDEAIYYAITTCALFNFYTARLPPRAFPKCRRNRTGSKAGIWRETVMSVQRASSNGAHHPS
jgi:uncharacterized peroxidase-related enzyme